MSSGEKFVAVAIFLLLAFPLGVAGYYTSVGAPINTTVIIPKFILLLFLCSMAYLQKNWARWLLTILSSLAALGAGAEVGIHFYTNQSGMPSPILFLQAAVYLAVAFIFMLPKPVHAFYKSA